MPIGSTQVTIVNDTPDPVTGVFGITLPPPEPPTAAPTLNQAPTVSSTPSAGQGVALSSAGFLPSAVTPFGAFIPTLTATTTNPTAGTGATQSGDFTRFGKMVFGVGNIVFGAGMTPGSGTYRVSLPVVAEDVFVVAGTFMLFDSSAVAVRAGALQILSGGATAQLALGGGNLVTDAAPWVWAVNDEIRFQFTYQAAITT